MKHILVLGAGFVSDALIIYINRKKPDYKITVIDRDTRKVQAYAEKMFGVEIIQLEINGDDLIDNYIASCDLVISLLPWSMHIGIAKLCLKYKKHFVSTSYAKQEMIELHESAEKEGLIFLNEMGADPGIDHMMTMKIIDNVRRNNGKVKSFRSYGTNLPAPQYSNNPFGYKFSWNVAGFLNNAFNEATYLENKTVVHISEQDLFQCYELQDIGRLGTYEVFPNRDSLLYIDYYKIPEAETVFRGTLRYPGFCETWQYIKQLGLYDNTVLYDTAVYTVKKILIKHLNCTDSDLITYISRYLNITKSSLFIKKLNWLGLFSNRKLAIGDVNIYSIFKYLLETKLVYHSNETDQVIIYQEIIAEYDNSKMEKVTALLNYIGNGQHSGISCTVGLPAAIASIMILENKIKLTGVQVPLHREIYEPILEELVKEGINIQITPIEMCCDKEE